MATTEEKQIKRNAKTFQLTPDVKDKIDAFCKDLKDKEIAKTDEEVLNILLNAYLNPAQPKTVDNPETEKQLNEKLAEMDLLNEKIQLQSQLIESMTKLFGTTPEKLFEQCMHFKEQFVAESQKNDKLQAAIEQQQRTNSELSSQLETTINQQNETNKLVVPLQLKAEFERTLLDLTSQRVSKRTGRDVTVSELLRTMFLRYTIERQTEWFYKFEIGDSEIAEITGISRREWVKHFNAE